MATTIRQALFGTLTTGAGVDPAPGALSAVVAGNSILVIATFHDGTGSTETATCSDTVNGSYGAAIRDTYNATFQQRQVAWFKASTGAGTPAVTVDISSPSYSAAVVFEIDGSDGASPTHIGNSQDSPTTTANAVTSTNLTPTSANGRLLGFSCYVGNTPATPAVGTGFTSEGTGWTDGSALARAESKTFSSTAAVAATFTAANNDAHITQAFAFYDASVTGPTITVQPSAAHVAVGGTASFSVTASASGGGSLSYQWKIGGVNVSTGSGGTTASYTTAALALSDDLGSYTCAVTETGGSNDGTKTTDVALARVGVIFLAAGAAAYSAAGGSTVAPAYPTVTGGIAAGDQLVCIVALKPPTATPNTGTVTTPTTGGTWNRPAERTAANDGNTGGYSTTIAADTGNVGAFSFDLLASGGESGTMTVSLGGTGGTGNAASVAWAAILAFRAPPGSTFGSVVGTTGKRTQNTTPAAGSVSEAMGADPGVAAGDYIVFAMAIPTDVNGGTTWSAQAVTQSGITYETAAEVDEPFTGNGDDIGGFVAITRALSGTSGGVPTVAATKGGTTTNTRGPILLLRLRASASTPPTASRRRALLGVGA